MHPSGIGETSLSSHLFALLWLYLLLRATNESNTSLAIRNRRTKKKHSNKLTKPALSMRYLLFGIITHTNGRENVHLYTGSGLRRCANGQNLGLAAHTERTSLRFSLIANLLQEVPEPYHRVNKAATPRGLRPPLFHEELPFSAIPCRKIKRLR